MGCVVPRPGWRVWTGATRAGWRTARSSIPFLIPGTSAAAKTCPRECVIMVTGTKRTSAMTPSASPPTSTVRERDGWRKLDVCVCVCVCVWVCVCARMCVCVCVHSHATNSSMRVYEIEIACMCLRVPDIRHTRLPDTGIPIRDVLAEDFLLICKRKIWNSFVSGIIYPSKLLTHSHVRNLVFVQSCERRGDKTLGGPLHCTVEEGSSCGCRPTRGWVSVGSGGGGNVGRSFRSPLWSCSEPKAIGGDVVCVGSALLIGPLCPLGAGLSSPSSLNYIIWIFTSNVCVCVCVCVFYPSRAFHLQVFFGGAWNEKYIF